MKTVIADHSTSKYLALPIPFQCRFSIIIELIITLGLLGENLDQRENTNFRMAGRKARNVFFVFPVVSQSPFLCSWMLHASAFHCSLLLESS